MKSLYSLKFVLMKKVYWSIALLILGLSALWFNQYPKLEMISGYYAKYTATSVFYAGHTLPYLVENDHQAPLIEWASAEVDKGKKQVSAEVYGLQHRTAVYLDGIGAILVQDPDQLPDLKAARRSKTPIPLPYPQGHLEPKDTVFQEVNYDGVRAAIDGAFAQNDVQKTRSVLVLYKGHLIGEKYASPIGPDTPILGWSMTKSVLATWYGILSDRGKLSVSDPLDLTEWQQDERSKIKIDDLLRMSSGLAWEEDYGKLSDVTRMLFQSDDMGQAALDQKSIAPAGTLWNYSSGTTNALAKYMRRYFDDVHQYTQFGYDELIDAIGMYSMLIEPDVSGTFVASSYGWASTRDWGRFGQLYLQKGNWNGRRIFAPEWVDYITTPTLDADGAYGAHFWLNKSDTLPDVPRDMYSANGHDGQYVYIIPSRDLVVVRTGLAEAPVFDANGFLKALLSAISPTTTP